MSYTNDYSMGKATAHPYVPIQGGAEPPNAESANALFVDQTDGDNAVNNKTIRRKSWTDAAASQCDDKEEKSPMYMAIYNMLAGCGIVGLPLQTKQSGIIPGIILMAIVAVFSAYTLRLLIKNGRRVKVWNYEDLCQKCWGAFGLSYNDTYTHTL